MQCTANLGTKCKKNAVGCIFFSILEEKCSALHFFGAEGWFWLAAATFL